MLILPKNNDFFGYTRPTWSIIKPCTTLFAGVLLYGCATAPVGPPKIARLAPEALNQSPAVSPEEAANIAAINAQVLKDQERDAENARLARERERERAAYARTWSGYYGGAPMIYPYGYYRRGWHGGLSWGMPFYGWPY